MSAMRSMMHMVSIAFVEALKMLHHLVSKACGSNRHCAPAKLAKIEETWRDILLGDGSADNF